ncbi:MAG TPA: aldose 1-epimerase [Bryobacteraceae bacterium]|jgi:aldose 1-epimerase|nr:aldose 1-epimerase [Bryobacteraceae bacterium]
MSDRAYAAVQSDDHGIPVIRLTDALRAIEVSIAPSVGNRAYEMRVRGKNFLYFPHENPSEINSDRHLSGIPFLAPWANRMPEGFHANGTFYRFRTDLNFIRPDQNGIPIHGLLTSSPHWQIADVNADDHAAWVTSRLEFWKYPELMANWPFAHDYEMTYRLADGTLEVSLTVNNRSAESMPIAVGFHPYFQLPGVPIEDAIAHIPVRSHIETDSRLVATGERTPISFTNPVSLNDHRFDDGFAGLIQDADGRATFSVEGRGRKIDVIFGPKYQVAIVYAPPGQNYICFEPMSAVTNGVNLAAEGKYPELQTVAPDGQWQESFWIRPT